MCVCMGGGGGGRGVLDVRVGGGVWRGRARECILFKIILCIWACVRAGRSLFTGLLPSTCHQFHTWSALRGGHVKNVSGVYKNDRFHYCYVQAKPFCSGALRPFSFHLIFL